MSNVAKISKAAYRSLSCRVQRVTKGATQRVRDSVQQQRRCRTSRSGSTCSSVNARCASSWTKWARASHRWTNIWARCSLPCKLSTPPHLRCLHSQNVLHYSNSLPPLCTKYSTSAQAHFIPILHLCPPSIYHPLLNYLLAFVMSCSTSFIYPKSLLPLCLALIFTY